MTPNTSDAAAGTTVAHAPKSERPARYAATWHVSIRNLTPTLTGTPGSQPLAPPVFAVHGPDVHMWQEGQIASHGLAAVAEDANNEILVSALSKLPDVADVFAADSGPTPSGPIPSGQSAEFSVRVQPGERVSIVMMLSNTNDGFTGVDSLELGESPYTVQTNAYDAGSEVNNERTAFIPGPCCGKRFVREPKGDVIRPHEGITGCGDLDPAKYGWPEPVAEITFTRQE